MVQEKLGRRENGVCERKYKKKLLQKTKMVMMMMMVAVGAVLMKVIIFFTKIIVGQIWLVTCTTGLLMLTRENVKIFKLLTVASRHENQRLKQQNAKNV